MELDKSHCLSTGFGHKTASGLLVTINYGKFIQTVLDFTIVAIAIFMMIKVINRLKRKEEAAPSIPKVPPEPSKEEILLTEIRDLLKAKI